VFGRRLGAANRVFKATEHLHPVQPHWYLAVIGTAPTRRGSGFGDALMTSRLARCDVERSPVYLESSNPDNLPFYKRYGFEVTAEITLPAGGPTIWPMWRDPC
jgi:ribosomal protein S18 acetylase RimI-like enzyme